MKNYSKSLLTLFAVVLLCASCENDAELTTLKDVRFSQPIEASSSSIVITSANLNQSVVAISWSDVKYPVDAPVTYALEFDVLSDAVGENAWANAIRVDVGEAVLSKAIIGNDLNNIATTLGLDPSVAGEIVVRVEANLDRKAYSDPITLTVTPYVSQIIFPQIYMIGGFEGFSLSAGSVNPLPAINNGIFQGYITFPATQSLDFKFVTDLTGTQFYAANSSGNFAEGGTVNLTVPSAGSYQITVNLNTMSYTAVPYSWGIIGTSTIGGWNTDTDMTYDYHDALWKYTGALISGALKFRLNDSWAINYGPAGAPSGNITNGVVLYDNPGAHTINTAANYEITYSQNPAAPASATYSVTQL